MGRRFRSFRFPGASDEAVAAVIRGGGALCKNRGMELTWYGRTCIRLRGKDAVVVNDPYPAIVGPTGRGITGDVITFSHPDDAPLPKKATKLSRDGGTAIPRASRRRSCSTGPASTRSTTSC